MVALKSALHRAERSPDAFQALSDSDRLDPAGPAGRIWIRSELLEAGYRSSITIHDPTGGHLVPEDRALGDFDIVFLDHRWESVSGLDALQDLKEQPDCPPVVFLTPQGDKSAVGDAIRAGAEEVLSKGELEHDAIVSMVRNILRAEGSEAVEQPDSDESEDDTPVSIARARVEPGVTTRLHRLQGIAERYCILTGRGRVRIGELPPSLVVPGDIVYIPPGCPQSISNVGDTDLIFLAVCTPRFDPEAYEDIEPTG